MQLSIFLTTQKFSSHSLFRQHYIAYFSYLVQVVYFNVFSNIATCIFDCCYLLQMPSHLV